MSALQSSRQGVCPGQVQTEEVRSTDAGALMHVAATTAEALIVVCGPGAASQRAALSHIIAVDPPSAHVQLKEVQLLTFHFSRLLFCWRVQGQVTFLRYSSNLLHKPAGTNKISWYISLSNVSTHLCRSCCSAL